MVTNEKSEQSKKPWYSGHRARMNEKTLAKGTDALTESELLEMLLMKAIPRRDVKPLVKQLLNEFESLSGVLCACPEDLMKVSGIKEGTVAFFQVIRAVAHELTLGRVKRGPMLANWEDVLDYAHTVYAGENMEKLYVLYLDGQLRLIKEQMQEIGSATHVPVSVRDMLQTALRLNANAVIMMHNHPSGDPTPSEDDIVTTIRIMKALQQVGISLEEHLIVGSNRKVHSMRAQGVLLKR